MMGVRPGRNCHQALRKLNTMIERNRTSYVLDADVKGFFSHLDHDWIMKFIGSRIKDPNILRLVKRMLKAGIMEDYQFEPTEEGSGQGPVCSPVIANIYMHYVLAWWFEERIKPNILTFDTIYWLCSYRCIKIWMGIIWSFIVFIFTVSLQVSYINF